MTWPEKQDGRRDKAHGVGTPQDRPAAVLPLARFVGDRTPQRVHDSPADQHHRAQTSRRGGGHAVYRFCARGVGENVGVEM